MRCSRCGGPRDRINARYCRRCHAAYMREWRKSHPLTEAERVKTRARAYAHVYLKRGKLERKPCRICGQPAQMHHPDYNKPLEIDWLCREHHLMLHRILAE